MMVIQTKRRYKREFLLEKTYPVKVTLRFLITLPKATNRFVYIVVLTGQREHCIKLMSTTQSVFNVEPERISLDVKGKILHQMNFKRKRRRNRNFSVFDILLILTFCFYIR